VSLIIWFVLLFFIIRVDKKVNKLEEEIEKSNAEGTS
jgi:CcmD family protein